MPAEATPPPQRRIDRSALMLMLSYVEEECRALGAQDSARHIAAAAAALHQAGPQDGAEPRLPQNWDTRTGTRPGHA